MALTIGMREMVKTVILKVTGGTRRQMPDEYGRMRVLEAAGDTRQNFVCATSFKAVIFRLF